MTLQIFRMPDELGGALKLFIDGSLYDGSFNTISQMRQWFINRKKHLKGHELTHETPIFDTHVVATFGLEKSHRVLGASTIANTYLVTGAGSVLRDHIFSIAKVAADFATNEATKYDAL